MCMLVEIWWRSWMGNLRGMIFVHTQVVEEVVDEGEVANL